MKTKPLTILTIRTLVFAIERTAESIQRGDSRHSCCALERQLELLGIPVQARVCASTRYADIMSPAHDHDDPTPTSHYSIFWLDRAITSQRARKAWRVTALLLYAQMLLGEYEDMSAPKRSRSS